MTPSRSNAKAAQSEDLNDNRHDKIDKNIIEKFESLKTEVMRQETELKISQSKTQCVQDDYDAKRTLLERLKHEKTLLIAQKTAAAQTKKQDREMEVFLQTVTKHKVEGCSKSEESKANTKLLKMQEIRSQSGLLGEVKDTVSSRPIIVENVEIEGEVNSKALVKSSAPAGLVGEVSTVSDEAFLSSGTGEVRPSWLLALPPQERNISCHCHWVTSDSLLVVSTQEQQKVLDMVNQVLEVKFRGSLPGHREGESWQAGELCIAQVPVTGQWCRGLVKEVNGKLAAITFVDYGDVQWCQLHTLHRTLYLLEIPTLSQKVRIEGVAALGEDALELMRELVEGQEVKLELTSSLSSQPLEARVFLGDASVVEVVAGLVRRKE